MTTPAPVDEPRVWTILVPAPAVWLTANRELPRLQRGRIVAAWRRAVVRACQHADLPKGITGPVKIQAVVQYAGKRPPVRDTPNLAPTIKACIDGLGPSRPVRRMDGTTGRDCGAEFIAHWSGVPDLTGAAILADRSQNHMVVTSAYRMAAKRTHPDRTGDDGDTMARLNAARDLLLNGGPR